MIKLIVGLGNPGLQYQETRHNFGFLFLDGLVSQLGGIWRKDTKFEAQIVELMVLNKPLVLLKPETFMNYSGRSVGRVIRYFKIKPEEMLVIHDDLDLEVGAVRLKQHGGHAGHNGLRNIIADLKTNEFYRLRIGIGRPTKGESVVGYVLSAPLAAEKLLIQQSFLVVKEAMERLISEENIR